MWLYYNDFRFWRIVEISISKITKIKHRAFSLRHLMLLSCIIVCDLQMMIGNAEYQCSCVRYVSQDNTALIVGLGVGLGLLLIIIVVIVGVILYRRRQKKLDKDKDDRSTEQDNEEMQHSRQLPDEHIDDEMSREQHADDIQYREQTPDDYIKDSDV